MSRNFKNNLLTAEQCAALEHTALVRPQLEEQFESLEQQHQAASLGMWVFLATEVMFFGTLFLSVGVYRYLYPEEIEKASQHLNWIIGGINTLVLLLSSLMIVLAVHYASLGKRKHVVVFLGLTALLGMCFLGFKGLEYYLDYVEYLIPGWQFNSSEWVARDGLRPDQVPHVKLFLFLYWVMTGLHGVHVTIGIGVVLIMMVRAWCGHFTAEYYSPIDVTALYWHFVDIVWIFLLPTLYLMGTHAPGQ
jgi:cytochrome c oxidase subunit III